MSGQNSSFVLKVNAGTNGVIDTGDTAWMAVACTLMMLMTPAVGILYAGLVQQKNMLTVLVQSFVVFALVGVEWSLLGFSLAFGDTCGHFIGNSKYFALQNVGASPLPPAPSIPGLMYFLYQLCACAVTPAIMLGSAAERLALLPGLLLVAVWTLIVYCPVAHWVWGDGWLKNLGAIDYAGGLVVHACAGYSALGLAFAIGPRVANNVSSHNNSYVVIGTTLLWFGWFGFNGGSAYAADGSAALAIVGTNLAASAGCLAWGLVDYILARKLSLVGLTVGAGCGLIAMTPGSGYCPAWSGLIIGAVGGALSNLYSRFKKHHDCYDDAADVFPAHGISGTWGVLAAGLWAKASDGNVDGAFFGRPVVLGYQLAGVLAVGGYCFSLTFGLAYILRLLGWLRVTPEEEAIGLDFALYEEHGYVIVPQSVPQPVAGTNSTAAGNGSTAATPAVEKIVKAVVEAQQPQRDNGVL